jgi:hypothetical protein
MIYHARQFLSFFIGLKIFFEPIGLAQLQLTQQGLSV